MKILCAILMLLTMGAACFCAWHGETAVTIPLCTAYLVLYDQMWRRDG